MAFDELEARQLLAVDSSLSAAAVLDAAPAVSPPASPYEVIRSFGGPSDNGAAPAARLLQFGTKLYGTTISGGAYGAGTVYSVNLDGSEFQILHSFAGASTDGAQPRAGLTVVGSELYGTTSSGGATNYGTLFSLNADGTNYQIRHVFAGGATEGSSPQTDLTVIGGALFGTTYSGGASGFGTVFTINTDGTGLQTLHSFSSSATDGVYPTGNLTLVGSTLFGTTYTGGAVSTLGGTLYSLTTDGSSFQLVHIFSRSGTNTPYGPLSVVGSTLVGTTASGAGAGAVYSINLDGSNYHTLHQFGSAETGAAPFAGVTVVGSKLYGTTETGGGTIQYGTTFLYGTLFSMNLDGSQFSLSKFSGTNGATPVAPLTVIGNTLFGTTQKGGSANAGVLFSASLSGTISALHQFSAGGYPTSPNSFIAVGSTLYALAGGGAYGHGTIVSMNPDGSNLQILHSFAGGADDGANEFLPYGTLTAVGSKLYGTTRYGGSKDCGIIFSINEDGSNYQILHSFAIQDGSHPTGGLTLVGATLYGTTSVGGTGTEGVIFSVGLDGSAFKVLYNFGTDGAFPEAGLTTDGTMLYGTTSTGGSINNVGNVFSIHTDGTGYLPLHWFGGPTTDGSNPMAALTLVGSTLYGTTEFGGSKYRGTLFALQTDGSGYRVLHSFTGGPTDGSGPGAALVAVGSTLYGTTPSGGTGNNGSGFGSIFSVNADGSNYQILHFFTGAPDDASSPNGDLTQLGGSLYGAAGKAFALALPGPAVAGIYVDGRNWSPDYRAALQAAGEGDGQGFAIPTGTSQQNSPLPWNSVDRIRIVFDEDVQVSSSSLSVIGSGDTDTSIGDFHYDTATSTATWTLNHPLSAGNFTVLLHSTGTGAVTDSAGMPLDGEWLDGASTFPSGNHIAGGDFDFGFKVLPGDSNADGVVNGLDIAQVASHWLRAGDILGDVNGDNIVNGLDIAAIASNWLHALPPPGAATSADGGTQTTSVTALAAKVSAVPASLHGAEHIAVDQALVMAAERGIIAFENSTERIDWPSEIVAASPFMMGEQLGTCAPGKDVESPTADSPAAYTLSLSRGVRHAR